MIANRASGAFLPATPPLCTRTHQLFALPSILISQPPTMPVINILTSALLINKVADAENRAVPPSFLGLEPTVS